MVIAWWAIGFTAMGFLLGGLKKRYGDMFVWLTPRKLSPGIENFERGCLYIGIALGVFTLLIVVFIAPRSFLTPPLNPFEKH